MKIFFIPFIAVSSVRVYGRFCLTLVDSQLSLSGGHPRTRLAIRTCQSRDDVRLPAVVIPDEYSTFPDVCGCGRVYVRPGGGGKGREELKDQQL